jgi:hypothetical protein
MKIKTIVHDEPGTFDEQVNAKLEEGYLLEQRGLIVPNTAGTVAHYAQLVLPDPPAEPEPMEIDAIQALRQIKEFCASVPPHTCQTGCPLYNWCEQLAEGGDPTDWHLPEVEG